MAMYSGPYVSEEFIVENVLKVKQPTRKQILFDSITMAAPWTSYVAPSDVEQLYWIATARSLAGNSDKRRKLIKEVMEARGFKRFSGGTNREVFRHYEDPSIVAKVALDRTGLTNNIDEYRVQDELFPRCTKCHAVSPNGVLGFFERVTPILTREEYNAYLPMIYLLMMDVLGEFVMDDVGTEYFKNIGVRSGYGVVILDYPNFYRLDGNKLICRSMNAAGQMCGGEIDYDMGLNHLYCNRCGKIYYASDLKEHIKNELVTVQYKRGGMKPMGAKLVKNGKVVAGGSLTSDTIVRPPEKKPEYRLPTNFHANLKVGGKSVAGTDVEKRDQIHVVAQSSETWSATLVSPASRATVQIISFPDVTEEEDEPVVSTKVEQEIKDVIRETVHAEEEARREAEMEAKQSEPVIPMSMRAPEPREPETVTEMVMTNPPIEVERPVVTPKEEVVEYPETPVVQTAPPRQPVVHDEDYPPNPWGGSVDTPSRTGKTTVVPADANQEEEINVTSRTKNNYEAFGGFMGGN